MNGHTLSEVQCPLGCPIFLDIEVWTHIETKHCEITSHEEINIVLREPSLIQSFDDDPTLRMYYRLRTSGPRQFRGLYTAVVVRLEEVGASGTVEGVVRTAYLRSKLKADGRIAWMPEKM